MVVRVPRIVIIGGGTDGTLTANRLRRVYGDSAQITVADRDDRHVYQPGMLSVLFGRTDPEGSFARAGRSFTIESSFAWPPSTRSTARPCPALSVAGLPCP